MIIICDKCDYTIDRDKYFNGELIEEYTNTYGTECPNCNHVIKPDKKPFTNLKEEQDIELFKEEMLKKLRNKIQGEQ